MRYLARFTLKLVREALGRIIIFINYISLPTPKERSAEELKRVALLSQSLSLYQFYACPFCVKTRRAIHRLNIPMTLRDAKTDIYRSELEQGGGVIKVPCLKIEGEAGIQWMYESDDIIKYLEGRFA